MADKDKLDKVKKRMFADNEAVTKMAEQAPNGTLYERRQEATEPATVSPNVIIADKDIKQRSYAFSQKLLKVPKEVDDFLDAYADKDAKYQSIYYKLLLIGMDHMKEDLLEGDVVVRF